ncbi:helix-turn-helix domain-containing protein [Paenibacillus gansuensis]|uniref:Helix-turn-helix domain-containing protein n=2 Tax=Paenibacillus gansuensis TaxID=306542 RepID=A0ABW5PHE0_9BACL
MEFFYYNSYKSGTYVDFHQHSCFELVYYVSGKGAMNLDGRELRYSPGSMTLTRPNFMHDERHTEATDVMFFGFQYDDEPVHLGNGLLEDTENREVHTLIELMKHELLDRKAHYDIRVNLLLNEVILLLGRLTGNEKTAAPPPEKLFYARRYLDENFAQPINLRTLAELSGYSEDHFRSLFKLKTGLSPYQYVISKRLDAARQLLLHSASTVSTIGMECGFSTSSQFIEMFRRHYGQTPLQFRKAKQAEN